MTFDGANIFMVHMWLDTQVTKIRVSDAAVLETYFVNSNMDDGSGRDVHYANEHLFVTDTTHLTKLRVSDGEIVAQAPLPRGYGMVDDGTYLWLVSDYGVEKIRMSDLTTVATLSGLGRSRLAFDGMNIWQAVAGQALVKIRASDALVVNYFPIPAYGPLVFDGTFLYYGEASGSMARIYASDGSPGGRLDAGWGVSDAVTDGSYLYIGGGSFGTTHRKFSLREMRVVGVNTEGLDVGALALDGANLWMNGYYSLRKRHLNDFETPAEPNVTIFDNPGWYQYRVPYNCGDLDVKLWGAGGGGNPQEYYGVGGAGGFVSATLDVAGGEWFIIEVGTGGASGAINSFGGEQSRILWDLNYSTEMVAGGGGGAGGSSQPNVTPQLNGYAAGGEIAQYPDDLRAPANNLTATGGENCGYPPYAGSGNTGGQGGGGYYSGGYGCYASGGPSGIYQTSGSGGTSWAGGLHVTVAKPGQGTFGGLYAAPAIEGTVGSPGTELEFAL